MEDFEAAQKQHWYYYQLTHTQESFTLTENVHTPQQYKGSLSKEAYIKCHPENLNFSGYMGLNTDPVLQVVCFTKKDQT